MILLDSYSTLRVEAFGQVPVHDYESDIADITVKTGDRTLPYFDNYVRHGLLLTFGFRSETRVPLENIYVVEKGADFVETIHSKRRPIQLLYKEAPSNVIRDDTECRPELRRNKMNVIEA